MSQLEQLSAWKQKGKWFKYKNYSIFCQISGEGPPLLLLHGFPTSSWDWNGVWKGLEKQYQIITLDMIGFGLSDKPNPYAYSVRDQADLVHALINDLGITAFHVMAHDYGVSVAQEMLARQNEGSSKVRIQSLCLLNGPVFPELYRIGLMQKLLLSGIGSFVSKLITRSALELNMQHAFGSLTQPTYAQLSAFWQLLECNNGRSVLHQLMQCIEERRALRNRWVSGMRGCDVPMGLIFGTDDPLVGADVVTRYRSLMERPYVDELPGVGHYPHMEMPHKVIEAYTMFRERFSASRAH